MQLITAEQANAAPAQKKRGSSRDLTRDIKTNDNYNNFISLKATYLALYCSTLCVYSL